MLRAEGLDGGKPSPHMTVRNVPYVTVRNMHVTRPGLEILSHRRGAR